LPTSPENGQAFDNTAGRRRPDKPVLLLVEDHPDMARYIAACLADAEFDLLTAADGAQGLDMALEQVPDLVILDVMLPSLDGFEVCRSLKSDERTSHVPVILLTAMADRDSRLSGTRLGGDLYLEKPFDPEELRLQIGRLLTQQQRMRRHYLAQAGLAPPAPPEETSAAAASPNPFVEKVLELIRANLSDSRYSVEQLSRDALVSPAQLNRKLNALTGLSAGQLIRKLRLKKAEQQLADPNQPVAAVALACGFEDASYFGRIFKKEKGVSPAEWRKKNR
jgi:CheY-like chemotaxis protein